MWYFLPFVRIYKFLRRIKAIAEEKAAAEDSTLDKILLDVEFPVFMVLGRYEEAE